MKYNRLFLFYTIMKKEKNKKEKKKIRIPVPQKPPKIEEKKGKYKRSVGKKVDLTERGSADIQK